MSGNRWIVVSGDCVCDHNVYMGRRPRADSSQTQGVVVTQKCGGALLLKELIARVTAGLEGWETAFGFAPHLGALPAEYHAFCLWRPEVANPREKPDRQCKVWRAVEPPLGYGHPGGEVASGSCDNPCHEAVEGRGNEAPVSPEILVLDDAGLGFRDASASDRWGIPALPDPDAPPRWVVLKQSGAIGTGALWDRLVATCRDRLVLIVSADQLRRAEVRISRGLSWEATAEDLMAELTGNPALRPLLEARHLIVTFRSDGAFWVDNTERAKPSAMLVFDAALAEGEWAESQGRGTVFGFLSCFVAAIVRELCRAPVDVCPDFETALAAGLGAGRELLRRGHGPVDPRKPCQEERAGEKEKEKEKEKANAKGETEDPIPGFPFDRIAARIRGPEEDHFASVPIPSPPRNRGRWMMLDEWHVQAEARELRRPHCEAALAAAVLGPNALGRLPVARFGALRTVDRQEIESLRTLRRLITDYERGPRQKRPLCLGVFGPPGAGKSFGVTQIAKAVLGEDVPILTFNLSQFRGPEEIIGALHQVRDAVLGGVTPVVFWDEFDANGYGWLQYLLAPMQDGAFQDGPITHPVGKSVFLFAGATSQTYESFGPIHPDRIPAAVFQTLEPDLKREIEANWRAFVLRKGPDFKSRLVGYLNVLGPNPRRECRDEGGRRQWVEAADDLCMPIRRALFLRGQFGLGDSDRLDLDMGVLRALLEVPEYKAGARSLEFLCRHLRQDAGDRRPSRSNLPGRPLLAMHVDADRFWEICEQDLKLLPLAESLARGFHEDWRRNPASQGNDVNRPWEELDESTRSSNIQQALRMSANLAAVGLRIEAGDACSPDLEQAVRAHIDKHIEVLAEAEHNGWMVERMLAGWRYANIAEKDSERKLQPLLLPYAQLPERQKGKDRRPIQGFTPDHDEEGDGEGPVDGYIERLKRVGFCIRRAEDPNGAS